MPILLNESVTEKLDALVAAAYVRIGEEADLDAFYAEFVERLFKKMSTPALTILHAVVGIAGEAGEVLDIGKKAWAYEKPLDAEKLIEELGDMRFYYQALLDHLGITDVDVIAYNIDKLSKRYATGNYTDEQANARADKQVVELPAAPAGSFAVDDVRLQRTDKPVTLTDLCINTLNSVGTLNYRGHFIYGGPSKGFRIKPGGNSIEGLVWTAESAEDALRAVDDYLFRGAKAEPAPVQLSLDLQTGVVS